MSVQFVKLNISLCDSQRVEDIKANIAMIDTIISTLLTTAATAAFKSHLVKFEVDTGQTKEIVEYASVESLASAVNNWRKVRQSYVGMLQPSEYRLMDVRNFNG